MGSISTRGVDSAWELLHSVRYRSLELSVEKKSENLTYIFFHYNRVPFAVVNVYRQGLENGKEPAFDEVATVVQHEYFIWFQNCTFAVGLVVKETETSLCIRHQPVGR